MIETRSFQKAARQAGLTQAECDEIITILSQTPDAGDLIEGAGGARKLRFGHGGKGKAVFA